MTSASASQFHIYLSLGQGPFTKCESTDDDANGNNNDDDCPQRRVQHHAGGRRLLTLRPSRHPAQLVQCLQVTSKHISTHISTHIYTHIYTYHLRCIVTCVIGSQRKHFLSRDFLSATAEINLSNVNIIIIINT